MFGREEIDEIRPAIEAAKAEGIYADGPVPPDTVFPRREEAGMTLLWPCTMIRGIFR